MSTRPEINKINNSKVFRNYYYLLSELKDYCKENGLPTSGGKQEITDRIAHFIDTGEILKPVSKRGQTTRSETITLDSTIEPNIKCSEIHRRFFKDAVGKEFTFNVAFQNWLKENAGKTYRDAVDAYFNIRENMKKEPTVISKQFEYNTYIRAFHADNPGMKLQDAIECWKYKKALPGHNEYEKGDLVALKRAKDELEAKMKTTHVNKLSDLPNIGPVVEEQLNQVGIKTFEELKSIGAENAWLKIYAIDDSACINRLLGIEGAIQGIKKSQLPVERQEELRTFVKKAKA